MLKKEATSSLANCALNSIRMKRRMRREMKANTSPSAVAMTRTPP